MMNIVFLYYYHAHKDLQSFPTRRSSDLTNGLMVAGAIPSFTSVKPKTTCSSATTMSQDRKSTRLNSSHMSISYAVFCLKKKIVNTIRIVLNEDNSSLFVTATVRVDVEAA